MASNTATSREEVGSKSSSRNYPPVKFKKGESAAKKRMVKVRRGASQGDIQRFLDGSEKKLDEFDRRIEIVTKKMEQKTHAKISEFERNWASAEHWLKREIDSLRAVELKAEQAIDTTKVIAHLAKMDAKDAVLDWSTRLENLKTRIELLRHKANMGAGNALKNLSDACLDLKKRLEHKEK